MSAAAAATTPFDGTREHERSGVEPLVTRAHRHPAVAHAIPVAASTAIAELITGDARSARLLGACPSAIYLDVDTVPGDAPRVVAVVSAAAVRLPLAAVVAGTLPAVDAGMPLLVGGGHIVLGSVRLHPVRWVDPRPRLDGTLDTALVAHLRHALDAVAADETGGVAPHSADDVARGLAHGDASAAVALIGRGPGLTPAGDDAVAGVLAALALTRRLDQACAAAVIAHAARATTALSAALLRCAADGQVVPQAAALLHALCGRGDAAAALDELLRVGSTSGAALALGLVAGVRQTLGG